MRMRIALSLLMSLLALVISAQEIPSELLTPFEKDQNTTATYWQAMDYYELLAQRYPKQFRIMSVSHTEAGSDVGLPLHALIVSVDGIFQPQEARKAGKNILLVNNAIHPGESCGVDASMMLIRDYLVDPPAALTNTVLVVIPVYNIGGALNRNSHTRANQNGPESYGFRGNARHLDLNRDFIKADSYNARSFATIFNIWNPDVFIDNHTSNGSDHQYTFTLIPTQADKLAPPLAKYQRERMLPYLNEAMAERGWEVIPYVYARSTPDEGIAGFLDLPRYSTGYAALHHTLGFMPETHMLKPYKDRVRSVYAFMDANVHLLAEDGSRIRVARATSAFSARRQKRVTLNWELDYDRIDSIEFKGYTPKKKPSEVSGQERMYYDRDDPFTKTIPHYNYYKSSLSVERPEAYVIPQAYRDVVDRLRANRVQLVAFDQDTTMTVNYYKIRDYKTRKSPYEGHYLHYGVEVDTLSRKVTFFAGDFWIPTDQAAARFIIETLEPQAPDSYFAWNFFDGILMQKEHFSSYLFEDLAAKYLAEDPALKAALEKRKQEDEEFAKSAYRQLEFIYLRSPHAEPGYKLYPVARVLGRSRPSRK